MKTFLLTICFLSVQTGMVAIAQDKEQTPVYLDDTQPIEVRVQDALNRMTVEEKTRLSYAQGKFSSPGCPRLGIPELWMSDGPHGVRAEINWNDWGYAGWTNDSCTAFPALTCLAASWNPLLAAKYGYAIGEEARYREKDVLLGPGVNGKTTGIVSVFQTKPASYNWQVSDFKIDNPDNMVIYELLFRDFTQTGSELATGTIKEATNIWTTSRVWE